VGFDGGDVSESEVVGGRPGCEGIELRLEVRVRRGDE
jgi:hypothetical protein